MSAHERSWVLLCTPENMWVYSHCTMSDFECSFAMVPCLFELMSTNELSWVLTSAYVLMVPWRHAHEWSGLLLAAYECSWLFDSPHEQPRMSTHEFGTMVSWALLRTHDSSWAVMSMVTWTLISTLRRYHSTIIMSSLECWWVFMRAP